MLLRKLARLLRSDEPSTPDFAAGHALLEAGRLKEAAAVADALCANAASLANGHYLRALIAQREQRLSEALAEARAAIRAEPAEPAYRLQLAEWLFSSADYTGAALEYEAALSLPDNPFARDALVLFKAAGACERARMIEQAQLRLEQALAARPDFPEARVNLATLVAIQGDAVRARAMIDALRSTSPGLRLRRALFLPAIATSREHIIEARERLGRDLDELLEAKDFVLREPEIEVGLTPFRLAYHGEDNLPLLRKLAALIRNGYAVPQDPPPRPRHGGRLRVGFVSTYFSYHSVGRVVLPLVQGLDRNRFEVIVFSIAPSQDEVSAAYRRAADRYMELPGSVAQAAQAIREVAPDALVFTDIGMHPITYFLAFWRLAPLQCALPGHSDTTGIDTIDAFVSGDEFEVADAQSNYSERLWRVPGFFLSIPDPPRGQPAAPSGRSRYFCPQTLFKLHPDFDEILLGILESDPEASIALIEDSSPWPNQAISARLQRRLGANARRVTFQRRLGHAEYLSQLARSPVVLDTLHVGGSTILEALPLGVPVVTLPTRFLRGRFGYGCYRLMDVSDCIAHDRDEYVRIATRLGRDPDAREATGRRLREASERLFDMRQALHGFEDHLARATEQASR